MAKNERSNDCKECHRKYRKEYYAKNRERELSSAKRWQSNWREKHPGHKRVGIPATCAVCGSSFFKHYKSNVCCSSKCGIIYRRKDEIYYYINAAKRRAKVKGLQFNLTYDYLHKLFYDIQHERCALSNVPIKLMKGNGGIHEMASLDRVDSAKGYVEGNVQFLALGINYMKNNREEWQAELLLELITKWRLS